MNKNELKAEIRKEWINVSDFLRLNTKCLVLEETETGTVTGYHEMDGRRFNLPKFTQDDDVRKIMVQSLINLME
jgi:hypothetical protein